MNSSVGGNLASLLGQTGITSRILTVPFSPKSIPGLKLWLDASQITGSDGDPIVAWTDESGNGFDATQALPISQPLLKKGVNGQNGKNVVSFDGTDDYLGYSTAGTWLAQPVTYFLAIAVVANARFLSSLDQGTGRNLLYAPGSWQMYAGSNLSGGTSDGDFHIWSAVFNGNTSALYIDGALIVSGNVGAQAMEAGYTIGAEIGIQFCVCKVGEVIAYSSALSDSDRQKVQSYLGAKFAVPLF